MQRLFQKVHNLIMLPKIPFWGQILLYISLVEMAIPESIATISVKNKSNGRPAESDDLTVHSNKTHINKIIFH